MAGIDISGGVASAAFIPGHYISAFDTSDHSILAPFAIETLEFNTTDIASGISIQGVNNTDIVIASPGVYNLQFSCQVTNNDTQIHLFYLWLCKNGAPVADTTTIMSIQSTHGGSNGHAVAAWNFVFQAGAGDSYQLCWTADNIAIQVETLPSPGGTIPAIPSTILTVTQV
jgi:hypothetical protein